MNRESTRPVARRTPGWIQWAALAFLVGMMLSRQHAQAAEADGLDAKKRAAKKACLTGDHAKGVALLAEIYVDTNNPIYLFNQGRCYQQNGMYEDAVLRFREYQRKNADAGGARDPEAERQIAECQSLLDKQKAEEAKAWEAMGNRGIAATTGRGTSADGVPPFAGTPATPQPAGGATVGATSGGTAVPPADTSWPVQKKLGYAAAGLGVLGLGISLTSYLMGKSYLDKSSRLGCSDLQCDGEAKDEYDRAQTAIAVSNVAGISGGVLLVGGLVLILTSPSSQAVAVVPVVRPGLAQLALTGRF
jgi:tetratricopeptide (TPR) repeat protein